jgi:hypothetical protein
MYRYGIPVRVLVLEYAAQTELSSAAYRYLVQVRYGRMAKQGKNENENPNKIQ